MKYWEVADKLKETQFQITGITTRDYLERYQIHYGDKKIVVDGIHNGAGIFNDFTIINPNSKAIETELLNILKLLTSRSIT